MMIVPDKSHPKWSGIVTGQETYALKSLAAQMVLARLTQSARENPAPENVAACVDQLHALFSKNAISPSFQDDLATIFG